MDIKPHLEHMEQEFTLSIDNLEHKIGDIQNDGKDPNETSNYSQATLEMHLQGHKNPEEYNGDTTLGIGGNCTLSALKLEPVHNTFESEAQIRTIKSENDICYVQDTNQIENLDAVLEMRNMQAFTQSEDGNEMCRNYNQHSTEGIIEASVMPKMELPSNTSGNFNSALVMTRTCVEIEKNESSQSWMDSENSETPYIFEQEHQNERSSLIPQKCSFCEKSFECADSLRAHLKEHIAVRPKATEFGDETTSNKCHICFKQYKSKKTLKGHLRKHSGNYECRHCDVKCSSFEELKVHLKGHQWTHKCTTCNKKFCDIFELRRHEATHRGFKPLKCQLCEKRFAYKSALKKHLRTHLGVRPHQCNLCEKSFTQLPHLRSHLEGHSKPHTPQTYMHLNENSHHCTLCEKSYKYSNALVTHMKYKHSGAPNFKCNKCDKAFVRQTDLNRHLLRHLGVKPFKCTLCQTTYVEVPDLTKHLNAVHKGRDGAMYGCDYCENSFEGPNELRHHLKQHQLQNTFKCTFCGEVFATMFEVSEHKAQHEDDEMSYAGSDSQPISEKKTSPNSQSVLQTENGSESLKQGITCAETEREQNEWNVVALTNQADDSENDIKPLFGCPENKLPVSEEFLMHNGKSKVSHGGPTEPSKGSTVASHIVVKVEPQESDEVQATIEEDEWNIEIKQEEEFLSDKDD